MIRLLTLLSILFSISFSMDLTKFEDRQIMIAEMKGIVLKEEETAKAYEEYILENYDIPTLLELEGASYLGSSFLSGIDTTYFVKLAFDGISKLTYSLKEEVKNDNYLKSLYESNTFRKNSFYSGGKINFIVKDDFAKYIIYLVQNQTAGIDGIIDCSLNLLGVSLSKYCKDGDNIYIYDDLQVNKLMYFYKENFKKGPIIITSDRTLQTTNAEFDFIPKGAVLYDEDGIKYVKTSTGIEEIQ